MASAIARGDAGAIAGRMFKVDQQAIVFLLFILIFVAFSIFLPSFFKAGNIVALLRSGAVLGILALGMAVVVIGRGIDLSMVALMAVPTAMSLSLITNGTDITTAVLVAFVLAIAFGLLNGFLVAYAEIPALFVTLATGIGMAGLGQSGLMNFDLMTWPPRLDVIKWLGGTELAGIPTSIITFAIVALCVFVVLRKLKVGGFIYAVGDNPSGARTSGIPVRPIIVLQYVIAAIVAVVAGFVMAASTGLMDTRIFNLSLIYDIILVVVLGGVGLSGGRGGVSSVIVGTLFVATLINGMTIMNLPINVQNLIRGVVLLMAIAVDSIVNPRDEETAQQGDI